MSENNTQEKAKSSKQDKKFGIAHIFSSYNDTIVGECL